MFLGFNVSAGDTMLAEVWACDSSYNIDYSGGFGCFYLYDYNTDNYSDSRLNQINTFQGLTGEFIAEDNAPNNACNASGTYTDFGTISKADLWTYDNVTGGEPYFDADPNSFYGMISVNASSQIIGFAAPYTDSYL